MRVLLAERERAGRFVPLARALVAAGHEVVVAAPEPTPVAGAGSVRFVVPGAGPTGRAALPREVTAPTSASQEAAVRLALPGEVTAHAPLSPEAAVRTALPREVTAPAPLPPEAAVRTGLGLLRLLAQVRPRFRPEVVVAVAAEGSGLFLSEAEPAPRLVSVLDGYLEAGRAGPGGTMVALSAAMHSAAAVCPSSFERSQFPWFLQHKLIVLPFGVRAGFFTPAGAGAAAGDEDTGSPGAGGPRGAGGAVVDQLVARAATPGAELIVAHCPQASPADGMTALVRGLAALQRARPDLQVAILLDGLPPVDPFALDTGLDPGRVHLVTAPDPHQRRRLHRAAAAHVVVGVRSPCPDLLLEAQACEGLVVAAGPGMTDAVQHGRTGYLAAPEGRALAELATWVLGHRERLGGVRRAARDEIVSGFDQVAQAERWVELVARVHARGDAAGPAGALDTAIDLTESR